VRRERQRKQSVLDTLSTRRLAGKRGDQDRRQRSRGRCMSAVRYQLRLSGLT
jgi:hypothetical protein